MAQVLSQPVLEEEVVTQQVLESTAINLARHHKASSTEDIQLNFSNQLAELTDRLSVSYQFFRTASLNRLLSSFAAEWILDNYYIVQQSVREIEKGMPVTFFKRLPQFESFESKNIACIYSIARAILVFSRLHLDVDQLVQFVQAYQSERFLTIGELWALPTMLRFCVLESLVKALSKEASTEIPPESFLDSRHHDWEYEETSVGHAIVCLRYLSTQEWKTIFETLSVVDHILRDDPMGSYGNMDFKSQDRYRRKIEELASTSSLSEPEIAERAIALARPIFNEAPENKHDVRGHVGYYLLDKGTEKLEQDIQAQPPFWGRLKRSVFKHPTFYYLESILLGWALFLGSVYAFMQSIGSSQLQALLAVLLFSVPGIIISESGINSLLTRLISPRVLSKMNFESGIPEEFQTIVVVPSLLGSEAEATSLLRQIEQHYLRNANSNLYHALLTDCLDAPKKIMPGDEALINQALSGIQKLNQKYGTKDHQPFLLFHRERKWNPSEDYWMGWERKRGKLAEFNQLIIDGNKKTTYVIQEGNLEILKGIAFIITLDADTILPRDSARRLIETFAHPLNHAQVNQNGELVSGFTVIQPRVQIQPQANSRSFLSRIYAATVGIDPYSHAVSNIYQDLFGDAIYIGKGIYDPHAFEHVLAKRIPENTLLSHDLFEGVHGRVGLASDILLFEDAPTRYLSQGKRLHRWVRGDWQLLPWLFPRVPYSTQTSKKNSLSIINRWKIFDNLLRSIYPVSLVITMVVGWLFFPLPAIIWLILVIMIASIPMISNTIIQITNKHLEEVYANMLYRVRLGMQRQFLYIAFLLHETSIILNAIGITLIRLIFTRKHLIQWKTMAHTNSALQNHWGNVWWKMRSSVIGAILLGGIVYWKNPLLLLQISPILIIWLIAPIIAIQVSKSVRQSTYQIEKDEEVELRKLCVRTWLFFEKHVGPEDNWLPPDHFQEKPRGLVAHRTSPTNIGLYLLSVLSAYDLGYITLPDLSLRLNLTLETLNSLDRYRGHFLNWFDTSNLEPLPARYISTVDSGNLAACLVALAEGLKEIPLNKILNWEYWQGLLDMLHTLLAVIEEIAYPDLIEPLNEMVKRLHHEFTHTEDTIEAWFGFYNFLLEKELQIFEQSLITIIEECYDEIDIKTLTEIHTWEERIHRQIIEAGRVIEILMPWQSLLNNPPEIFEDNNKAAYLEKWEHFKDVLYRNVALNELAINNKGAVNILKKIKLDLVYYAESTSNSQEVSSALVWCEEFEDILINSQLNANALVSGFQHLELQFERMFWEMDFTFLFNKQRKVFHIGYNLDIGQLDANYYDLLASEARLASYLAIAKGDVPQSHWLFLGRPFTQLSDARRALVSWSGTMFEYLMPDLVMQNPSGSLLEQTNQAIVRRHISYGKQKKIPWGISESGFYHFDLQQNYQYKAFGVPGTGFKRGLSEDLVISPYASMLAIKFQPRAVLENFDLLKDQQMLGLFGLYEAIDFTPTRMTANKTNEVIHSYMAHHQGMILIALTNFLLSDPMVKRFHKNKYVQSIELLLYEAIPENAPVESISQDNLAVVRPIHPLKELESWMPSAESPVPQAHYLSNGKISTLITMNGAGYITTGDRLITRWRADTTLENWGTWLYIKDMDTGHIGAIGRQPCNSNGFDHYSVEYFPHQAVFSNQSNKLFARMAITINPTDNIEIRKISLSNQCDHKRNIFISSYSEIVLSTEVADRRHQAFNKLFLESEFVPELNLLLFKRRPRSSEEPPIFCGQVLVSADSHSLSITYECDRGKFIGRNGSMQSPEMLESIDSSNWHFSETNGIPLDSIIALGTPLQFNEHQTIELALITITGKSRQEIVQIAQQYSSWGNVHNSFYQAQVASEKLITKLELETLDLKMAQQLFSALTFAHHALRPDEDVLIRNIKGQSSLWRFAISGDYPILLVRINQLEEASLVVELLRIHELWRNYNIKIDLVILNLQDTSYNQDLHHRLLRLCHRTGADLWFNRRGGIFLLSSEQLALTDRTLLETSAKAVLDGANGKLEEQLVKLSQLDLNLPTFVPVRTSDAQEEEITQKLERPMDLLFDNGIGGFSADGKEYIIYLEPGITTPAPWINVIANPHFGCLISESGSGYTWAENSGENRLTTWGNDPVLDVSGETLYLRDEDTGAVWSPTARPSSAEGASHLITHGAGYTQFETISHGLKQKMCVFVSQDEPIKFVQIDLENLLPFTRRISTSYYAEWVLGTDHSSTQQYIQNSFDTGCHVLLARNPYNEDFKENTAFLASTRIPHGITTDRTEFLGQLGSYQHPQALNRVAFSGRVSTGPDPCGALQNILWLAPGEKKGVTFLIGQGENREHALSLVKKFQNFSAVQKTWEEVAQFWDELLNTIVVDTPDQAMNIMLNRWLLYQSISCRVWGRSALYQSSGAYGYRDQLQDVMACIHTAPEITRQHILRAANHQFAEGDVLHWWHPPSGQGIRTRCSDDLLWLPYVVAHYINSTGDNSILSEELDFLYALPLNKDEKERYGLYPASQQPATLLEHCQRAIEFGYRLGRHGLPLFGSHDWNDGMSEVGIEGQGESVWNAWFLYDILESMSAICEKQGDKQTADIYRQRALQLKINVENAAWDGAWYYRAFYDDGTPLGSHKNDENQIDALAQSWSVISGAAKPKRAKQAMQSVMQRLVRKEDRLVLLFTPPFNHTKNNPGYIKGYPPGIRENGGQYTHAAIWTAWAFAQLEQGEQATNLFDILNPIYHSDSLEKATRYRVEPYVIAADVYSVPPYVGRGGWTWYTGSASWMYRLGVERILGINRVGDALLIAPSIPPAWRRYQINYRYHTAIYKIRIENPESVSSGVRQISLNGEILAGKKIPLEDDGLSHDVEVIMGSILE